jgi:hypothetical protein
MLELSITEKDLTNLSSTRQDISNGAGESFCCESEQDKKERQERNIMNTKWFEQVGYFFSYEEFNIILNTNNGSVELKSKSSSLKCDRKHYIAIWLVRDSCKIHISNDDVWLSTGDGNTYLQPGVYNCDIRSGPVYTEMRLKMLYFKSLMYVSKDEWLPFTRRQLKLHLVDLRRKTIEWVKKRKNRSSR